MKEMKITPPEGYVIDEERSTIYNIVFKKKDKLPTSWEEFCKNYPVKEGECYIDAGSIIRVFTPTQNRYGNADRNVLPSKETAKAHLALMQLHQLRDVYRQGWIPDWKDKKQSKWVIKHVYKHYDIIHTTTTLMKFLSFQTREITEEFLINFRDLIEKAEDLI